MLTYLRNLISVVFIFRTEHRTYCTRWDVVQTAKFPRCVLFMSIEEVKCI